MIKKIVRFVKAQSAINIGFCVIESDNMYNLKFGRQPVIFQKKTPRFRLNYSIPLHLADPILFYHQSNLYIFYEVKSHKNPGEIFVSFKDKSGNWISDKCNLNIKTHLSFPFLIQDKGQTYMIPESCEANEISLFQAVDFPRNWTKMATILKGNYVDSHIHKEKGNYYLFTTLKKKDDINNTVQYELKLYFSDNLFGKFEEHPCSPIQTGRKFGRSGGPIIHENGRLFRSSQDCEKHYGDDLHLFEIIKLNPNEYQEILMYPNWVKNNFGFEYGGHHLSQVKNKTKYFALDLNYRDSWFQRWLNIIRK